MLLKMPGVMLPPLVRTTRERWQRGSEAQRRHAWAWARAFRILPPVPFERVASHVAGADLGVISVER